MMLPQVAEVVRLRMMPPQVAEVVRLRMMLPQVAEVVRLRMMPPRQKSHDFRYEEFWNRPQLPIGLP